MSQECPPDESLFSLALGEVSQQERKQLEEHVRGCDVCREVLSDVLISLGTKADEETSQSQAELNLPRLERYELRKVIGAGGAGIVYLAFDPSLHRDVAVKLLRPDGDPSPSSRGKLLREARAIAKLSHPNVVVAYDVGETEQGVFIVLEYHPGGSLEAWLGKERTTAEILRVLRQAGEGLRAAHEQGVVHRDFKPHNVLVGADGRACVTDFGLAGFDDATDAARFRMDSTIDEATQTRGVVGTPTYMAPEVLGGMPADEKSDQFSFCVTAYQALNGRHPFGVTPESTLAELVARVRGELYYESGDHVPASVARAIKRGLSANPSDRFASIGELLEALKPPSSPSLIGWGVGGIAAAALVFAALWFLPSAKPNTQKDAPPLLEDARAQPTAPANSIAPTATEAPRAEPEQETDGESNEDDAEQSEPKEEAPAVTSSPRPRVKKKRPPTSQPSAKDLEKGQKRYDDWLRDPF